MARILLRRYFFLLAVLAVVCWQSHELAHDLGLHHHEESCELCVDGATPSIPPAVGFALLVFRFVWLSVPVCHVFYPHQLWLSNSANPRAPPSV